MAEPLVRFVDLRAQHEEVRQEIEAAIKQQQEAGQQDPALIKLQMEQQLAQAKFDHETQLAQMKSAGALQMAQLQASLKQQELEFSSQFKLATMQLQHEDSQRRERIELMKLAQAKQMSQAQLMVELEKLDKQQTHDTQKFMAEVKMKQILPPTGNYGLE